MQLERKAKRSGGKKKEQTYLFDAGGAEPPTEKRGMQSRVIDNGDAGRRGKGRDLILVVARMFGEGGEEIRSC